MGQINDGNMTDWSDKAWLSNKKQMQICSVIAID